MSKNFLSELKGHGCLLCEVELKPAQGSTFQATGFPDLGPARYQLPDKRSTEMVLVESSQSMANRMELAVWDTVERGFIHELEGLPYIRVLDQKNEELTNSVLEAHRINSEYILKTGRPFNQRFRDEVGVRKGAPVDWHLFYATLFKYDPTSLIHGCFLEEIDGRLRVTRALAGFIEAANVRVVESGGVKINLLEPQLKAGEGNVPYHRVDFTAETITAYFELDLALLGSYALDKGDPRVAAETPAIDLLIALSLLKIRRLLTTGLRLRTSCRLRMVNGIKVTDPRGLSIPEETELLEEVRGRIARCTEKGLFAKPPVTEVPYP